MMQLEVRRLEPRHALALLSNGRADAETTKDEAGIHPVHELIPLPLYITMNMISKLNGRGVDGAGGPRTGTKRIPEP